jgi:hypothetical protein
MGSQSVYFAIGVALQVFTLAAAGICMYFWWFDTHIGSFVKRILIASLGGSALLGGSGALGVRLGGLFGMHGAVPTPGPVPTPPADT